MSEHITLSYGDFSISDLHKLPAVSLHRLASYGFAHLLGNQASSKVVAWGDKEENANATDEQRAAFKRAVQEGFVEALLNGTIGQHASRGPAVDPIEAEMERLAKVEVTNILKANNIKVPKKDEAVKFADGTEKTMADMVATRVERFDERLRDEATKSLKAKAKAKEAAAKKVAGQGASELL